MRHPWPAFRTHRRIIKTMDAPCDEMNLNNYEHIEYSCPKRCHTVV